jgi:hypothetical protein
MKKTILLILFAIISVNAQNKFGITGNLGFQSSKNETNFLLNSSLDYQVNKKIAVGIDTYVFKNNFNSVKTTNNQFYIYGEFNPKLYLIKDKLNINLIGGLGLANYKNDFLNENKFSSLIATKINYKLTERTSIGLKQGFLLNNLSNNTFVAFYVSIKF